MVRPGFCLDSFRSKVTRPPDIPFEKHTIDLGSSESAAIADISGDGKVDIISGENWYETPHWTKHHFRNIRLLLFGR
jgi:hypothetical protein